MTEIEANTPPRYPPNPMLVSKDFSFYLKVKAPLEGLRVLRWVLTQFYKSGQKFDPEMKEVLFLLSEYFNGYRNESFYIAHGIEFLKLKTLARIAIKPTLERNEVAVQRLLLSQGTLMSPRLLLSFPADYHRQFLATFNRSIKADHPEQRRIGVGYRDKGTASIPSNDGSPRWGEVAVSFQVRFGLIRSKPETWWRLERFFLPSDKSK